MGLKFRRVKRVFGFDKTKTEKYLVVPDRGAPVSFKYLCEQVALISGINSGMVYATLHGMVRAMRTFIEQGHAVNVEGFGSFIPTFSAKSSTTEKEANADSIRRMKLRFVPCAELREMMDGMVLDFNDKDSTNDSETSSSEEEEEDKPEEL